jgi:16S rRNA G966 N2-methylase RsmD
VAWLARESPPVHPWNVVVLDPPYAETDLLVRALEAVGRAGVVAPSGRVVAKHFWKAPPPARIGLLASDRERRFGETALTFYRLAEDEEQR